VSKELAQAIYEIDQTGHVSDESREHLYDVLNLEVNEETGLVQAKDYDPEKARRDYGDDKKSSAASGDDSKKTSATSGKVS
jgi:hypothetical protein